MSLVACIFRKPLAFTHFSPSIMTITFSVSHSPFIHVFPLLLFSNHESECHSPACILGIETTGKYLNNFTAYNTRWTMPSNESGGVLNMWFSWNYADVHFVSIDTSTDFPNAPEGKTGKFDLTISIELIVRKDHEPSSNYLYTSL